MRVLPSSVFTRQPANCSRSPHTALSPSLSLSEHGQLCPCSCEVCAAAQKQSSTSTRTAMKKKKSKGKADNTFPRNPDTDHVANLCKHKNTLPPPTLLTSWFWSPHKHRIEKAKEKLKETPRPFADAAVDVVCPTIRTQREQCCRALAIARAYRAATRHKRGHMFFVCQNVGMCVMHVCATRRV